jgi:hypothetical protein
MLKLMTFRVTLGSAELAVSGPPISKHAAAATTLRAQTDDFLLRDVTAGASLARARTDSNLAATSGVDGDKG